MRRSAAQLMRATANAAVGHTRTAALPAPASVAAVAGSLHACNEHCAAQHRQTHIQQLRCSSSSSGRALAGADCLHLLLMYVCVMAAVNGMQTGLVICVRPVEKGEGVPQLRWPLPIDVLAGNPELAQAALADAAAQAHARQQQEAQPRGDASAADPLEYRESSGSASSCLCACQKADALPVCTTLDRRTNSDMGLLDDVPRL